MSQKPFNLSPDLKRLRDEGYAVQIRGGLLVVRDVPYVNAQREVKRGVLISTLQLAADKTLQPDTHVAHFDGEFPCGPNGEPIQQISHQTAHLDLGHGVTAEHSFSSKPADTGRYEDYYHKMTTYAAILSGPATVLQPGISPRTYAVPEADEETVFNYLDTASYRAGIGALTEKLAAENIGIIGLGGTGSYVLDFVAKTPASQVHLFDGDDYLQHNAFRAPGAPALEALREMPKKVDYFHGIYSKMRRGIFAHAVAIGADNLDLLNPLTFAFICIDGGDAKRLIVEKLEGLNVPFVDVGMGLDLVDGSLGGILRVTASTPEKRDHVHQGRLSFAGSGEDDLYSSNIQVADLNALNAVMAVIKWKKIRGFYRDLECEHHSTYTTDGNMLLNRDRACCDTLV